MRIANFLFGWIGTIFDNEIEIVSTKADPPKIRLAVEADQVESNLGAVSYNLRRPDGNHEEYGLMMGRLTADHQAGAVYVATRPRGQQDVREVFYIDNDIAIFRAPVVADLTSDNGRFRLIVQNDGNLVLYEGDQPLWASNTVRPQSFWSRLAFWQ